MELKLKVEYTQILKLVQQLPHDKFEKLTKTLQAELKAKKNVSKKKLEQLILKAPTWTEREFEDFQAARNHLNSTRIA